MHIQNVNQKSQIYQTGYWMLISFSLPSGELRLPSQAPRLSVLYNTGTLQSQFSLHTVQSTIQQVAERCVA